MNRKFLVLFAAVGTLLLVASFPAAAQQHRATRLGNPATRFANPIHTPEELRAMLRSEALRKDVEFIARESGYEGTMEDLLQAAATANILPLKIPVGTRLPAMSSRKQGKAELLRDVLWAGTEPIDAYEFYFTADGNRYRLVCPKACANFWMEDYGKETKPALALECEAPGTVLQNRPAQVCLTIKNTGDDTEPLATVTLAIPAGATMTGMSEGGQIAGGNVTWAVPNLAAGGSRKLCGVFTSPQAGMFSFVSMAQGNRASAAESRCETRVMGVAAVMLEVIDLEDPIQVGSNQTYEVTVLNQGSASLTNVKLVCTLEEAQEFVSGEGTSPVTAQERTITLEILPELKGKETAKWRVVVRALTAADVRFTTKMSCDQIQSDVEETESTQQY